MDDLDEAQRLVADPATMQHLPTATALALIDIAHSLRDIRDDVRDWDTYGLNVRKHTL